MKLNATAESESTASTDDLSERDIRALTEYLTVLPEAPDLYTVVSESGKEYTVDARDGACECWDDRRDDRPRCKHRRRVEFETGERALPSWVDRDALPSDFGIHVNADARQVATDGGEIVEAGDEGAILEREPDVEYSSHIEPPAQGGERYARCEACGAELLTRLGGAEKMIHREGCPAGEYR